MQAHEDSWRARGAAGYAAAVLFLLISKKYVFWRLLGLPDFNIIPGRHVLQLSTYGLSPLCLTQSLLKIDVFKLLRERL